MDFDFSDDQQALRRIARDFLRRRGDLTPVRSVLEDGRAYDQELWTAAAGLGWIGTAIPQRFGGSGLGPLELAVLAEELGRTVAAVPFSISLAFGAEALLRWGSHEQKARDLPAIARGDLVSTVALVERPGRCSLHDLQTTIENGSLKGAKIAVPDAALAQRALVVARTPSGAPRLVWVDLCQERVVRSNGSSLDPTRPCGTIDFRGADAETLEVDDPVRALERLWGGAAVLVAFEQLGGAVRAFEITKEYTESRFAFGRPIASFQALKHRLVDVYVALELARSHCLYGAWTMSVDNPELPLAAATARVAATDAFELAAREMIQLHGGIGFTWEHDSHLFYRRAKVLALLLGNQREWRERLVHALEARTKGDPDELR